MAKTEDQLKAQFNDIKEKYQELIKAPVAKVKIGSDECDDPKPYEVDVTCEVCCFNETKDGVPFWKKVLAAPKWLDWCDRVGRDPNLKIKKIHLQSVDMFGPNVGFMKWNADASVIEKGEEKFCPGIVFCRGGAPAILVIFKDEADGKQYALVVNQPRLPVGYSKFPEIPAGMLNEDGNLTGVAAKEMKEETHIQIQEKDLINMSEMAYDAARKKDKHNKTPYKGMYPSCGGSDEYNILFVWRKVVESDLIDKLRGKKTGVFDEDAGDYEQITLDLVPLEDLWKISSDAKALGALGLYNELLKNKMIEEDFKDKYTHDE